MGVNEIIPVEGSQPGKTNGMKTEPKGNNQTVLGCGGRQRQRMSEMRERLVT